jgi:hypothetical protein
LVIYLLKSAIFFLSLSSEAFFVISKVIFLKEFMSLIFMALYISCLFSGCLAVDSMIALFRWNLSEHRLCLG